MRDWAAFWQGYGKKAVEEDFPAQTQVLRTSGGRPFAEDRFEKLLEIVISELQLTRDCAVLDLGAGNGAITRHLAGLCSHIVAVDVSPDLLCQIKKGNVLPVCADIRTVDFEEGSFDRILLHSTIQYLTRAETAALFVKFARWMKAGGIMFIGDIPSSEKLWYFYSTPERRRMYFDNLRNSTELIGTWFDPRFISFLARDVGLHCRIVAEPPALPYSAFRFDARLTKDV